MNPTWRKWGMNALGFLVIALLLVGSLPLQLQLKALPLQFLFAVGIMSFAFQRGQSSWLIEAPRFLFLALLVFLNLFVGLNFMFDVINPNDGYSSLQEFNNHSIMAANWIWASLFALLLLPLFVWLYVRRIKRNLVFESLLHLFFLLQTCMVYIYKFL